MSPKNALLPQIGINSAVGRPRPGDFQGLTLLFTNALKIILTFS
jgi:hypothetical protein